MPKKLLAELVVPYHKLLLAFTIHTYLSFFAVSVQYVRDLFPKKYLLGLPIAKAPSLVQDQLSIFPISLTIVAFIKPISISSIILSFTLLFFKLFLNDGATLVLIKFFISLLL